MKLSSFLIPGILIMMVIAAGSCSKSNNGKPQISIKSITAEIPKGGDLDVDLKFTSAIRLDTLAVFRIRINQIPPQNVPSGDTVNIEIPEYSASKGELEFTQPFSYLSYGDNANDTLVFKFIVFDVNSNHSDTLTSPKVVIHNL